MKNDVDEERVGPRWLRRTVLPLALILSCPPGAMLIWYTHTQLGGSVSELVSFFGEHGPWGAIAKIWGPVFFGTARGWAIIGIFAAVQLLFMRILPGKRFEGPITPKGNVPVYKANGVAAFTVTMLGYAGLSWGAGLFKASVIFDNLGGVFGALNVFSLVFCLGLYLKGRFAPSTTDSGYSGNFIFDYYWGTELYPRVFGWDLKMFTNCRFGMMLWPVMLVSYAAAQAETATGLTDAMVVSVGLQLIYIAKFFWWETGYLRSLDIMHDRAGFYICWGCLVWVPTVYTSASMYLVKTTHTLGYPLAIGIFVVGLVGIFANYFADAQRQRVRATNGETKVWGKKPVLIVGHYTTKEGEAKESLLLASGFWGIARHFHYVPELLGALCWTLPALFHNALPWFYFVFLVILLTDRAFRDDNRCATKYGDDWKAYCEKVPYKIIPGVI
jgi:7-dehydrocholesterol reductase